MGRTQLSSQRATHFLEFGVCHCLCFALFLWLKQRLREVGMLAQRHTASQTSLTRSL